MRRDDASDLRPRRETMKEFIGRNSELTSFRTILENWHGDSPLWVHFQGEPGSGKTHLIRFLYHKELSGFTLLYRFNCNLFQFDTNVQLYQLLHHIYLEFPNEMESFIARYPRYLRCAIFELFRNPAKLKESQRFSSQFFNELLLQILEFFSGKKRKPLIILENINFEENKQTGLLRTFLAGAKLPILILTSGTKEPPEQSYRNKFELINVQRLSAIDIQNFIRSYLCVNENNARFIANHLQIKSGGIPAKIKFLLEAYYRDIIPGDSEQFVDTKKLHQIRISPVPEVIFQNLVKQFSGIEISIFIFLSQLLDPLPLKIFQQILQALKAKRSLLKIWLEKGYLCEEKFAGENFVFIEWEQWKEFLGKQREAPGKTTKQIMWILDHKSALKKLKFHLQLSHIYFEMGDKKTALRHAIREANLLRDMNLDQRAYERFSFLKRNLADYRREGRNHEAVYQGIGDLQQSLGLYENAFETLRELRDRLAKDDKQSWFKVSLQMAEILLRMDAFAEARYLLNDLKIKKAAGVYTKSFAMMLLGDLDKNLGQDDYALKKYEKALSFLEDGKSKSRGFGDENQKLVFQLYSKIRKIYLITENKEETKALISSTIRLLRKGSRYHHIVRLDLVRYYMDRKKFDRAHKLAFQLLKEIKRKFDPSVMTQLVLYLVEIYAYFSKWYLARSHLRELVRLRLFFTTPKTRARMFIHLAVIEKEIAGYGEALRLLSEAEKICKQENYTHEQNEIKIHKGHIQMLIHGYLRQREFLADALQWAIENHDPELFISASLYMSYYELQQSRLKKAKEHLDEARVQIKQSGNEIDKLNYIFYLLHYLLKTGCHQQAGRVIKVWRNVSNGITKFENLALWFEAKLLSEQGEFTKSLEAYEISLDRSRRYQMPHLEFHILKEMVILCHHANLRKETRKFTSQLKSAFKKLLAAIDDEILRKQFHESREVEELAKIGIRMPAG